MNSNNLIGKMLGNRYEILEKVGTGGMATVYKAKCHLLNRFVAVKILRDELRGDDEFVKKFSIESQAAASLSHHNIVSIFDVGEEDGINYIVMEYIEGITLKEYIKNEKPISWKEASVFGQQIGLALQQAHQNHIIHRDIKSHNILITKDLTIKVTDFGIAHAVSSETRVVGGSSALGSVHYISPEQARGGYTDERSDIYSMGIVLYEMLAGDVPFDGDNQVAVALMHIEKEPKDILEIRPEIPKSLGRIVMRAIAKEQHMRYQTVADMVYDLKKVIEDFGVEENTNQFAPTQKLPLINDDIIGENSMNKKGKKQKLPKTPQQKKEDKLAVILALGTVALILSLALGVYLFMRGGTYEVQVPDLLNMTLEEATIALKDTKFKIEEPTEMQESDVVEAGKIISQDPGVNQSVKKNTKIKLVISSGKGMGNITVPDVSNLSYDSAIKLLKDNKLDYVKEEENSSSVAENIVIRQSPTSGTKVSENTVVRLYVSLGTQEKISVPNLSGATREKAESMLTQTGLQIGSVSKENSDSPIGTVIKQVPESGKQVSRNSFVNIVLSNGEVAKTQEPETTPTQQAPTNTPQAPAKTPTPTVAPIMKTKTLTVKFPDTAKETISVKVIANGQSIYNATHNVSEGGVRIPVQGTKDAQVKIYLDDKLVEEKTITFD